MFLSLIGASAVSGGVWRGWNAEELNTGDGLMMIIDRFPCFSLRCGECCPERSGFDGPAESRSEPAADATAILRQGE